MERETLHLKLVWPTDVLALRLLRQTGVLPGEFVREMDPPWDIWYSVSSGGDWMELLADHIRGAGSQALPWEAGTPDGPVQPADWIDLLRNFILHPAPEDSTPEVLLLRTTTPGTILDVVRQHFLLQQGQIEIARFQGKSPWWLLKIRNPSGWALSMLPEDPAAQWFGQVPEASGFFVEKGWTLADSLNGLHLNRLTILDNAVVMVTRDGTIEHIRPVWEHGNTLVEITCPPTTALQEEETAKIVLEPRFRPITEVMTPQLWRVDEAVRLQRILANTVTSSFTGYSAWYGADEKVWILGRRSQIDRGLAELLSDAFPAYYALRERVFLPVGRTLLPRLPEDRLRAIFSCLEQDFLCLDQPEPESDVEQYSQPDIDQPSQPSIDQPSQHSVEQNSTQTAKMVATVLPARALRSLDYFLTFRVDWLLRELRPFTSTWKFDFPEVKKKRMTVLIEEVTPGIAPGRLQGAVGGWFGGLVKKLGGFVGEIVEMGTGAEDGSIIGTISSRVGLRMKPQPSTLDLRSDGTDAGSIGDLKLPLEEIDAKLLENIEQPRMWRQRAAVCQRQGHRQAALVSELTAALLTGEDARFLKSIKDFAQLTPELRPLVESACSASQRGMLLAGIRKSSWPAEQHFALNLLYAAVFADQDIFQQTVNSMKSGYSGESRSFAMLEGAQLTGLSSSPSGGGGLAVALLGPTSKDRIKVNVNNFLVRIGVPSLCLVGLVRTQFYILLKHHLGDELARKLVSPFLLATNTASVIEIKNRDLENYPDLPSAASRLESTKRWFELLTMDRLKQLSLDDMFLGRLYRPVFLFPRKGGCGRQLKAVYWLNSLSEAVIPAESDGRPIAQAIYRRFCEGRTDWNMLFRLARASKNIHDKARAQRLLLMMTVEFGPVPEFAEYIEPLVLELRPHEVWDVYGLTLYCDIFRLSLAFRKKLDEQRLFNALLARLPKPPEGWSDFRDIAEHLILCLFLNGSKTRRFQLDNMLERSMAWLGHASVMDDETQTDEALTILSFLEIGTLTDLVPESLQKHQFFERRRAIWLEYARRLAQPDAWPIWRRKVDSVLRNFSSGQKEKKG